MIGAALVLTMLAVAVGGAIIAWVFFAIVAVFVPVAFMYGIAGQWFKPFALTIACSVLVSLFVSFSLDLGTMEDSGLRHEPQR